MYCGPIWGEILGSIILKSLGVGIITCITSDKIKKEFEVLNKNNASNNNVN